jgi:division protein CdvB (Snf7/Vps24/ESCRT-III family)
MNISSSNQLRLDSYKSRLQAYYMAEEKILEGQSYSIGSRSLTRANLSEVRSAIKELESKINSLESRGTTKRKVARIIPRDF